MNRTRLFASIRTIVLLLLLCSIQSTLLANPMLPAKNIKYEKVLGYHLYPYIELENNTFFVIQDEITWQHYFTSKKYDLRSPKVVDLDFAEDMLIVIFKKTHEIWKFDTEKVTNQNGNLYVAYEAKVIGVNAFKTSNFLHIIKVKKGDYKNIRFFENHVPITDIPIDEQPKDAINQPITFIPEFEEKSREAENTVDTNTDMMEEDIDGMQAATIEEEAEEMTSKTTKEINKDIEIAPSPDVSETTSVDEKMDSNQEKQSIPYWREKEAVELDSQASNKAADHLEVADKQLTTETGNSQHKVLNEIPDVEEEIEDDDFLEDQAIIGSRKMKEPPAPPTRVKEEPGINNTGPSVKDKLANIMKKSETVAEEQMEELEEETTPYKTRQMKKLDETTEAAVNNIAESNQQFGFNVYEQLAQIEKGNIAFSPFALSTALSMSYAGARNSTESQMLQTLQFQQSSKNLHRNYENLLEELVLDGASLSIEQTGTELMIGNAMWIDQKFDLSDPFMDVAKKQYRGNVQHVDFKDKAVFLDQLNDWMKVKTAYNVLEGLPTDFKPNESNLLLTNTLHLKTKWQSPFDRSFTQATTFKLREDSSFLVNMMHTKTNLLFFENSMVKAVAVPCNDDYSLLVLLPKAYFQLKAVQKTLMRGGYAHWLNSMEEKTVQLSLPRFNFNTQADIVSALQKIGMTEPFDKKTADFSGIFNKRNSLIGDLLHPIHMHINESGIGTDENLTTGLTNNEEELTINKTGEDNYIFEANRPFLFVLMDNHRRNLLLMGRVMQPELAE